MKRVMYILVVLMMVAMMSLGGIMVFSLMADRTDVPVTPVVYDGEVVDDVQNEDLPEIVLHTDGIDRISPSTVMTFDYYQRETGGFDSVSEHPSPFLLGLAKDELVAVFADWEILSFTSEQVHLRQDTALFHRQYIISIHEGFIAVFYDDETGDIKELTNRPISALAQEEQQRLIEGIRVTGNDELLRALEDFGS
ncbi:MAG: hypothetical protein FWE33_02450 [Defluviitaleaceae bacterium]|nr:hypothetical protein [Defluviitaleaceae bacterium]